MRRTPVFPYLRPRADVLRGGEWRTILDGEGTHLDHTLPDWDPASELHLEREYAIDAAQTLQRCGLAPGSALMLSVGWFSTGTKLQGDTVNLVVPERPRSQVLVSLTIPGALCASELRIQSRLVLLSAEGPGLLSPTIPGSILVEEEQTVTLEGAGARFPMEVIPFSQSSYEFENDALWFLDFHPDSLDEEFLGSVRLYLNSEHPRMDELLAGEAPDLLESIRHGIARLLITAALQDPDRAEQLQQLARDPERHESMGAAISRMLVRAMPGAELPKLRESLLSNPAQFETRLQAGLGLYRPAQGERRGVAR